MLPGFGVPHVAAINKLSSEQKVPIHHLLSELKLTQVQDESDTVKKLLVMRKSGASFLQVVRKALQLGQDLGSVIKLTDQVENQDIVHALQNPMILAVLSQIEQYHQEPLLRNVENVLAAHALLKKQFIHKLDNYQGGVNDLFKVAFPWLSKLTIDGRVVDKDDEHFDRDDFTSPLYQKVLETAYSLFPSQGKQIWKIVGLVPTYEGKQKQEAKYFLEHIFPSLLSAQGIEVDPTKSFIDKKAQETSGPFLSRVLLSRGNKIRKFWTGRGQDNLETVLKDYNPDRTSLVQQYEEDHSAIDGVFVYHVEWVDINPHDRVLTLLFEVDPFEV
jgi:hypothetical protein